MITKPNQMSSGASKINEALEKIEAQFAKEEKDQISFFWNYLPKIIQN